MPTIFAILLTITAVFLILLVLVQRGRGGGLAGALGGMGGSSAFGAKAGDTFTYITYVAACVWILLCIAANRWGGGYESRLELEGGTAIESTDEDPAADANKSPQPITGSAADADAKDDGATRAATTAPATDSATPTGATPRAKQHRAATLRRRPPASHRLADIRQRSAPAFRILRGPHVPLLSMTGFGDARHERADHALAAEVRTINNRHFKLNLRTTEGYGTLEARIESIVREYVRRGTVNVNVRIRHISAAEDYRVNLDVLSSYVDQLQKLAAKRDMNEELRLEPLASLPGVIEELSADARDPDAVWPLLEPTLRAALEDLTSMRVAEGGAMADDLQAQCTAIDVSLKNIAARAPLVVDAYRQRLQDRVREALSPFQTTIEPLDLVREVCLFSDRSDISEEIVRLRSHLGQFAQAMQSAESAGRKLEFICQEMGRETNTIGSKANDAEISHEVVEIKTALERIREQIQNVE